MTPPPSDPRGPQQPGWPPPPAAHPAAVPAGVPLWGSRPKEVEISFWLWITYLVLGVVGAVLMYPQIEQIRADVINQALAQNPAADRAVLESFMTVLFGVGAVVGLLLVIAEFFFVFRMRGGRNWARIVLAVLGGVILLFGVIGLAIIIVAPGLPGASGASSATGLLQLQLQLLLLSGAIVTMFLPAANAWFRPRPPGF